MIIDALPYIVVSAAGPLWELDGLFNLFVVLEVVTLTLVLTRVAGDP